MKKLSLAVIAAILAVGALPKSAHAQWAVIDHPNLVQSIISALENTQAVSNQITQLAHEIQSLAFQAQNLQGMPGGVSAGVLNAYTSDFARLAISIQSINGIAQNVAMLTQQYNATYPHTALAQGPLSNAAVLAQLTGWINQSRNVYQGAYATQAQVMASLPADTQNVRTLLQTSNASPGALGAIQAGNQLSGQVAAQLMKINQQMATTDQAQMNWIAQQTQLMAQAQKTAQQAMTGYATPSTAAVNLSYDRFH